MRQKFGTPAIAILTAGTLAGCETTGITDKARQGFDQFRSDISEKLNTGEQILDRIRNVQYQQEAAKFLVKSDMNELLADVLVRRQILLSVESATEADTRIEGFGVILEQENKRLSVVVIPSHMKSEGQDTVHIRPTREQDAHPLVQHGPFARVFTPDSEKPLGEVPHNRFVQAKDKGFDIAAAPLAAVFHREEMDLKPDRLPLYIEDIPTGTPLLVMQWQWGAHENAGRPIRANMANALYRIDDGRIVVSATSTPGESGGMLLMVNPSHLDDPENKNYPPFLIAGFLTRGVGERLPDGRTKSSARPGAVMMPGKLIYEQVLQGNSALFACLADPSTWHDIDPCSDLR